MTTLVKCPTCNADVAWNKNNPYRPFCSDKCRLIDLGDWANENHAIAGKDGEAEWLSNSDGNGAIN